MAAQRHDRQACSLQHTPQESMRLPPEYAIVRLDRNLMMGINSHHAERIFIGRITDEPEANWRCRARR
jgi:hypothetical protein